MAKRKTEDEIDDLVDELDELDDEDEDSVEVEVDEEIEVDEDPDEAPKAKKRSRSKKKATTAKKEKSGVGTKELAEEAGVETRQVRAFLRSSGYQPRDEREGRYNWASTRDPEFREIVKKIKGGAVDRLNKEKLDDLKKSKASKKSTRKKSTSKSK